VAAERSGKRLKDCASRRRSSLTVRLEVTCGEPIEVPYTIRISFAECSRLDRCSRRESAQEANPIFLLFFYVRRRDADVLKVATSEAKTVVVGARLDE
jgi:hypothetical protein